MSCNVSSGVSAMTLSFTSSGWRASYSKVTGREVGGGEDAAPASAEEARTTSERRRCIVSPSEQRLELGGDHRLELSIGARFGRSVRPPAKQVGRVAEPGALQVVVADFHHPLDPDRLPGKVLLVVPAARSAGHSLLALAGHRRPLLPGVVVQRVLPQRRDLCLELLPLRGSEARADADVVQGAVLVVQA